MLFSSIHDDSQLIKMYVNYKRKLDNKNKIIIFGEISCWFQGSIIIESDLF